MNTPLRARTPALPRDEMEGILNGLGKLNLGTQAVLGDRTNVQAAIEKAKEDAKIDSTRLDGKAGTGKGEVIVISSDSESGAIAPLRRQAAPKALRLNRLAGQASSATDNATLARLVKEFTDVLQMNSSRTLTKEAFYFLDVLYKQLDDPSVFVRTTRRYAISSPGQSSWALQAYVTWNRTSRQHSFNEQVPEKEPARVKLGVVARLRQEVGKCQSNKALAALVSDFAKVTNKSTGRTVTKVRSCQFLLAIAIALIYFWLQGRICLSGRIIGKAQGVAMNAMLPNIIDLPWPISLIIDMLFVFAYPTGTSIQTTQNVNVNTSRLRNHPVPCSEVLYCRPTVALYFC